jgi:predicted MPP superfamily phosphohydrolase
MHSPLFLLFFACYLLLCAWIAWCGMLALPRHRLLRAAWLLLITFLSLALVASFFLSARLTSEAGQSAAYLLRNIGVTWILSTPYWAMGALLWRAAAFAHKRWRVFPAWVAAHYPLAKMLALAATIAITAAIFAAGYLRFTHPITTTLNLRIQKPAALPAELRADPASPPNTLRIALAADFHLGDTIGLARLRDYVARINALHADIILLPGDIIDYSVAPLEAQHMDTELARLHAPLGVYAVLGNHEGYAGAGRSVEFLAKCGIRVLRDEALPIAGGAFYLAGRNDRGAPGRAPLAQILDGLDHSRPIILMDHQPRDLAEPAAAGIDLQFSGHTHGGQIWPVTWIARLIYEKASGYLRKGDFQLYVTTGLGLWGFPARIGSDSEIVEATLTFAK